MSCNKNIRLNWSQYNWEEFEDICYEYASERYCSDLYKVSITERRKDGGRDIIITELTSNKLTWGECKHHKRSVGLDDIGKNVVLAITNQLQKIIFFSVSDVTPNTKHEILCAAKIHGFDVLFLDGKDLDCEIAGNKKLLNKYFKESFELFNPSADSIVTDVCIDEFVNAYSDTFYKDSRYHKLQNGLDFYIHIFLKNYYSFDITSIKVNVQEQSDCHFDEPCVDIDRLHSFCDTIITIHGVILNSQRVVSLSQITVSYCVNEQTMNLSIPLGEIDGRGIWKVPICGSHNIEYLASINSLCEQVINGYTRMIYLRGVSGSGKTRMLEEISMLMISKNFMPVYLDAMKFKKNLLFRELIRQLLCLPHLNAKNIFEESAFESLLRKFHISFPDITMIYKFMWKNKYMAITILGDFIYECITRAPATTRLYIQIDNIQNLDEDTQSCLLYLCSKLSKERKNVCFAFAFNTSLRKNSMNAPLIQYLENQRLHEEDSLISPHTMRELDTASRKYIVKEILHMSDEYDKEIVQITEKSGALPLDILLFCKMLCNSDCFIWNEGVGTIRDSEKFSEYLSTIPDALSSIIQIRWEAICKNYPSKKPICKLLQLLLFFTNRLPLSLIDSFQINTELVSKLKEDLVIVENPDASLSFFHDNYYRYFLKQDTEYHFNAKELSLILKYSKKYEYELGPAMEVNQAKCLYLLGRKEEFHQLSDKLLHKFKLYGHYHELIDLASFYLNKVRSSEYINQRLNFAIEMAIAQMEAVSFTRGIKTLKKIEEKVKLNNNRYDKVLIGKFYHQYVNFYTHSGKYHMALTVLHSFKTVEGLNFEQKFLIEDRYGLCHYVLGYVNKAETHIKKALNIAKKSKNDFWLSTAYSDRAFNYFINTVETSKIKRYFRKAIKLYSKETDTSEYRYIEIKIQSALLSLLESNYNKANSYINEAILQAMERAYTYLLIPAQNVKAYILLKKDNIGDCISLLEQARLNSEIFGNTKYMITIWNSLGIAYHAQKDYEKSRLCFSNGEKALRAYSHIEDCANRFAPLIANWLLSSMKYAPDVVCANKKYYQYYTSDRTDNILNTFFTYQTKNFSINLSDQFPLVHEGYALMY